MTPAQFLVILRAHYKIALLAFFITVSTTLIVCLLLPKQYTASSSVVLDLRSPDRVTGMMLPPMLMSGYMATQIEIMNSDRVAQAVVKSLKLDQNPAMQAQWQEATEGRGNRVNWLAEMLQKKLDIQPSRESNVITVNFTGTDPDHAASVVNAFVQAYIDVNLEMRLAPAREYAAFFEEQTRDARERLQNAQKALSTYKQQNGITSADEHLDFETAKLNETSSQLTGVQGQTTDSQSKRTRAKASTLAEVMQSPLINTLKSDISRLEAKLTESNVNLGNNHPQTQRMESELATLKAQLENEVRNISTSIETTYQVSKDRERQLKGSLAGQKNRVLILNKQRDELNVLRRDIESAQRAFEVVSQRASQTNIESQANQTNIAVLSPAVAPNDPSKPKILLNVLVSVFLGALLGVGLALMLEQSNRPVRSREDLLTALEIPVLGSISSASGMLKQALPRART